MKKLSLILIGCLIAACARTDSGVLSKRHGVLVVAIDCLRADRTSLHGYDRETTPFLDSLSEESLVFERHYAVTPDLLPSHISLLTGCDPRLAMRPIELAGDGRHFSLPKIVPRLARTYLANGYRTAAFSDSLGFSARQGFEGGFEEFLNYREGEKNPEQDFGLVGVSIRFKRWLRELGDDESWFAYMQVHDLERIWRQEDPANDRRFAPRTELDYVPPLSASTASFFAVPRRRWNGAPTTMGEYEARYEGNLRECDQILGRIVSWLQRKGYWETTTLVVTGTYGISFGEAGLLLSSETLTEGDLRVPWLIRPEPGLNLPVNQRIDQLTCALDLAPTLIDLSGLDVPSGMHGISHEPAVRGFESDLRKRVFAEGGIYEGFAVVTRGEHLLRLSADSLASASLRRSFFGTDTPQAAGVKLEFSVEASEPGTGRKLDLPPERVEQLTRSGLAWARWVRKARDVVHGVEDNEDVRAELVRRGLLAE